MQRPALGMRPSVRLGARFGVDWAPIIQSGIEAGTAITTTAITVANANKKKGGKKRKARASAEEAESVVVTQPAPAVPWGPVILGTGVLLAAALLLRPAPVQAPYVPQRAK